MSLNQELHSSVTEIRKSFLKDLNDGCKQRCPVCMQHAQIYKRKLNSGMASILCYIYRYSVSKKPENGWLHVNKALLEYRQSAMAKEYSKLRFWGLIERPERADKTVNYSGMWRITPKGIAFIKNEIRVSKHVYIYDNCLLGEDDETTNIISALKNHFDYTELMGFEQ